jgi:tetratricopeptide (TPR) repeat protein
MQAMQRHAFVEAADGFRSLLESFPGERGLRDRSQVYLALCQRELERRPAAPRTIEERLTAATAALNDGQDDAAKRLARGVLEEQPEHDLALYLLAAIEARRGATDDALQLLSRAIEISPEIRAQARHDVDFEDLRGMQAFQQLIDIPTVSGPLGARRGRRNRTER